MTNPHNNSTSTSSQNRSASQIEKARGIWILAEGTDGRGGRIAAELLARAHALREQCGEEVTAVVFGLDLADDDLKHLVKCGADHVIAVEHASLEGADIAPYVASLEELIRDRCPAVLIAAATTTGRTLMPYLAIRLQTGLTADCTDLAIDPETGDLLQTRPAIGGNIMATIRTAHHRPQMATVRPHSVPPHRPDCSRDGSVERYCFGMGDAPAARVRVMGVEPAAGALQLEDAGVIVGVGRGIRSAENLYLVRELADVLGAALGASRDVVDRGWLPYPHQVGLSGKTVTPRLYLAVGISGSIQHLAGMQTSETIVAINSDPDAQIFRVAEIGIVGDLFDIVPALTARLKQTGPEALINPQAG